MNAYIPIVVERSHGGERAYDIFSKLLKERIVFLYGEVNDAVSTSICAQLLFLEAEDASKPVHLYINSPGGVVTSGLSIYDTMEYIRCPVATYCIGQACSVASLLLMSGENGMRYALPNSRIMIHQPHGGVSGQVSDIMIHADEISKVRKNINRIYSQHMNISEEKIIKMMDRDYFMSPKEALDLNLIDEVVYKKKVKGKKNVK